MPADRTAEEEAIQRLVAQTVARHPPGLHLVLIGGFRYRVLNESVRRSLDIDYHWSGDLDLKQTELIHLFQRVLLPEVRRAFGHDGLVAAHRGPGAESPALRIVDLAFWKEGVPYSRIEVPVEITRIACADPLTIRTAGGTIYPTVSDADMIESKVIALIHRIVLQHRDLVDLFLFQSHFLASSAARLKEKFKTTGITHGMVEERLADLKENPGYHARAIQEIIETQLEPVAAAHINAAGGGSMILVAACEILDRYLPTDPETKQIP